jgi:hypothetical protein
MTNPKIEEKVNFFFLYFKKNKRLFFAGEHCSINFISTIHGAFISGRDASDGMMQ